MDGATLEELDATIQVAVLGAYVDGKLAEEERDVLRECIAVHAENEPQARVMISFANRLPVKMKSLTAQARNERLEEIRNALPDRRARERAFALAVDLTNAHQGIGVREMRYLMVLVTELRIEPAYARALLEDAARKYAARHAADPQEIEKTLRSAMDTLNEQLPDPQSEEPRVKIESAEPADRVQTLSGSDTLRAGTEPPASPQKPDSNDPDTVRDEPLTEKDGSGESHNPPPTP
jgi:hypothetical protein